MSSMAIEDAGQTRGRPYDLAGADVDYPEWRGPPRRTLIICTQQRCGSTLLGEAIFLAGGLGCPVEYLHPGFRPGFAARWKAADLQTYVAALHRFRTDPSGTLAIKLFWRDIVDVAREFAPNEYASLSRFTPAPMSPTTHRGIFAIISGFLPNPTFVFLRRQDQIRQAVSLYRAVETQKWRKFADRTSRRDPIEPPHDFHRIFRVLATIQLHNAHWLDFFRANEAPCYALNYEDLDQAYEPTLARFFAAIGRPGARIAPPRLRKQADAHSEKLVRQFIADVHKATRG